VNGGWFTRILSAVIHVATDVVAGILYPSFSFTEQAVSELFAIGAPTSWFVVPLFSLSSVLLMAFAFGLWLSSGSQPVAAIHGRNDVWQCPKWRIPMEFLSTAYAWCSAHIHRHDALDFGEQCFRATEPRMWSCVPNRFSLLHGIDDLGSYDAGDLRVPIRPGD